jgi:hypothetical protein
MHPEITQEKPGRCPKCGMRLVLGEEAKKMHLNSKPATQNSYKPLIIIITLITLVTISFAVKDLLMEQFKWPVVMMNFMAGFFLIFSGFKLIDLKGFAEGYSTYDLIAKKFFGYGYIYPFIEFLLGLLYAIHFVPPIVNLITFVVMGFSGIGVAIKIAKHEQFQCACLGTFLKVPLTKVTLIEDFGMAAMAAFMIVMK